MTASYCPGAPGRRLSARLWWSCGTLPVVPGRGGGLIGGRSIRMGSGCGGTRCTCRRAEPVLVGEDSLRRDADEAADRQRLPAGSPLLPLGPDTAPHCPHRAPQPDRHLIDRQEVQGLRAYIGHHYLKSGFRQGLSRPLAVSLTRNGEESDGKWRRL